MTYRLPIRGSAGKETLSSVVNRQYREVPAVQKVPFALAPGEVVGFTVPTGPAR